MVPTTVIIPNNKWSFEIISWLNNVVGYGVMNDVDAWRNKNVQWSYWFYNNHNTIKHVIEFKDPDNADMFKLAWF